MTKEEIADGNMLIAEFMEIPKCDRCTGCGNFKFGPGVYLGPFEMKYHESWDWIVPVCQKFFSLKDNLYYKENVVKNIRLSLNIRSEIAMLDIDVVYKELVDGIKWYNTVKK